MAMNSVNNVPALASSELINTLKGWGGENSFYITTDGGNMIQWMCEMEPEGHSFCPYHDPPCSLQECVEAAVVAGSDIADGSEYNDALAGAVTAGNVTLGDAQQRLFNTLMIRFRLGLFDPPGDQPYLKYGEGDIATPQAAADNALAARQGLVLLAQGPLPFPRGSGGVTAVLGFCGNSTSSLVSNYVNQFCPGGGSACFPSIAASIGALGEKVVASPGCFSPTNCPPAAVQAALATLSPAATPGLARVVLCLGISQSQEGEQKDRINITMPSAQSDFYEAVASATSASSLPMAVVLVHGGALAVPEVKAGATAAPTRVGILDAFYPGPEGGGAIADTLFGGYNPGGKLPYTVYDAPYTAALDMADMRVAETGRTYRYLSNATLAGAVPPLWPFGYGLSYTSFELDFTPPSTPIVLTPSSPTTPSLGVTVKNTGGVAGDEVVQVYVVAVASTLAPPLPPYIPVKSLAYFDRVRVAAGGSVRVEVPFHAHLCNLTLSDGSRAPINGNYTVVLSRGVGVEVHVPLVLQGWW